MRRTTHSTNTRSITRLAEVAVAAPQVIATRSLRMLAAGANPNPADRTEFLGMWTEKGQAFWESLFAMGVQIARANQEYARTATMQWMQAWTRPWWLATTAPTLANLALLPRMTPFVPLPSASRTKRVASRLIDAGLGPVHKRVTANARRLTRTRKRRR